MEGKRQANWAWISGLGRLRPGGGGEGRGDAGLFSALAFPRRGDPSETDGPPLLIVAPVTTSCQQESNPTLSPLKPAITQYSPAAFDHTSTFSQPPTCMSIKGTQSVLDLLASYQGAAAADSPPLSYAAARREREQARLARYAAAGAGQESVPSTEDVGPPRLRVKPPLSSGQRTYSPSVPGTPEVISSPGSAIKDDHQTYSDPARSNSPPRSTSTHSDDNAHSTRRDHAGSSSIAEIPPFNPARSRPTSPTRSAASAKSVAGQADDVHVPMDLMQRLRQKQKAAHDSHAPTPPASAQPSRSPVPPPLVAATVDAPAHKHQTNTPKPTDPSLASSTTLVSASLPASPALVALSSPESAGPVPLPSSISERGSFSTRPTSTHNTNHFTVKDILAAMRADHKQPAERERSDVQVAREAHEFHAISPIT